MTDFEYVEYHDCRMLGPNTRLIKAHMADANGEYLLYSQYKCPFCSTVRGEREYAKGVTPNSNGGYSVDTRIAEKLQSVEQ